MQEKQKLLTFTKELGGHAKVALDLARWPRMRSATGDRSYSSRRDAVHTMEAISAVQF